MMMLIETREKKKKNPNFDQAGKAQKCPYNFYFLVVCV
jgi:hypothetical protein